MIKHETKNCPRCEKGFECKSGDITNCQCETVELLQHHREHIAAEYTDCLCAGCMKAIRSEYNIFLFKQKIDDLVNRI